MVAFSRREPGQDRLALMPTGVMTSLRPTTTVRIDRLGRKKPLIADASVARVGETVRIVCGSAVPLEIVR